MAVTGGSRTSSTRQTGLTTRKMTSVRTGLGETLGLGVAMRRLRPAGPETLHRANLYLAVPAPARFFDHAAHKAFELLWSGRDPRVHNDFGVGDCGSRRQRQLRRGQ